MADTFRTRVSDASLHTWLQVSAQHGTVSRKLYFRCISWSWSTARGFHGLVTFLEQLGIDLRPLAVLLDHLNADAFAVSPSFLSVTGPLSSPSVAFCFSPMCYARAAGLAALDPNLKPRPRHDLHPTGTTPSTT